MSKLTRIIILLCVFNQCFSQSIYHDQVYVGGYQKNPSTANSYFPKLSTFLLESNKIKSLNIPGKNQINVISIAPDGTVFIIGGEIDGDDNFRYLAYKIEQGSNKLIKIKITSPAIKTILQAITFDNNSNAYLAGWEQNSENPVMYKVSSKSNLAIPITRPDSLTAEVALTCATVNSNGKIIFSGDNISDPEPVFYVLNPDSTQVNKINRPDVTYDDSFIYACASDKNGNSYFVGEKNGYIAFYLVNAPSSGSSSTLLDPVDLEGQANCITINSDGTPIIGGSILIDDIYYPYLAQIDSSSGYNPIALPSGASEPQGAINCIASDNIGGSIAAGGQVNEWSVPTAIPIAYRVIDNETTTINFPDSPNAVINSIAIASNGDAIMVGITNGNNPIIYRLLAGQTEATILETLIGYEGSFTTVAIRSDEKEIYDINRILFIYEEELLKTKEKLNEAGM